MQALPGQLVRKAYREPPKPGSNLLKGLEMDTIVSLLE